MAKKPLPQDFSEVLTDFRGGTLHHELSIALQRVTEAVQKTGKVGSIALTLKIKPQGEGQVEVLDSIKENIPQPTKPSTFMFVDFETNHLLRDNPRQATISDIKVLNTKTGEVKEVGSNG